MSPGKGGISRCWIADRPIAAEIARHTVIELRRIGPHRFDDPRYRRQNAVFDIDAFGGVTGRLNAVGDNHRHRVPDVSYLALRQ